MRNVVADLCYPRVRVGIGKFFFGDIAREQGGLSGQEEESLHQRRLFGRSLETEGELACVQVRLESIDEVDLRLSLLVSSFSHLLLFGPTFLDTLDVGKDQLCIDDFDVPDRIDR